MCPSLAIKGAALAGEAERVIAPADADLSLRESFGEFGDGLFRRLARRNEDDGF